MTTELLGGCPAEGQVCLGLWMKLWAGIKSRPLEKPVAHTAKIGWPKEGSGILLLKMVCCNYCDTQPDESNSNNSMNVCSLVLKRARVHAEVEWSGKWFWLRRWPLAQRQYSAFNSTRLPIQPCASNQASKCPLVISQLDRTSQRTY